jgi:formate-dependent nitrite reductase membrane component NrfD
MMEQIYNDFTTKLLPQIQTGLTISKDYFLELFGRYVKYLIVLDSVCTLVGALVFIIGLVGLYKGFKYAQKEDFPEWTTALMFFSLPIIFGITMFFGSGEDLIQDLYIPEIRVIEEIKNFNR